MDIKTVSQLAPLDEDINNSSYFGISQYSSADGGKYYSRKASYEKIRDQLSSYIDNGVLNGLYQAKYTNGTRIPIR